MEGNIENTLEPNKKLFIKKLMLFKQINDKYNAYFPLISKFNVITTRFKTETYIQLYRYKEENNIINNSLYGVNTHMTNQIDRNNYLFVLEMNNTVNKIMGVGLIKNNLANNQQHIIYNYDNFNKYIYKSSYHIQLIEPNTICNYSIRSIKKNKQNELYCKNIHEEFINFFEKYIIPKCFFGKGHLKRGGGFTSFPMKYLQPEIMKMFVKLFIFMNPADFNTKIIKKLLSNS